MEKANILVIIITYNNQNSIGNCLRCLSNQVYTNYSLLLIDNNSSDKTIETINEFLKKDIFLKERTNIIINKKNAGFAKSVNIGLEKAIIQSNIKVALLINPDTIFTIDLLESGYQLLINESSAGACSPKILYPDKRIWWIGTNLFTTRELLTKMHYGIAEHINKGKELCNSYNKPVEVKALTGCAMFIKKEAIKKTGKFNEKYFMYVEDIDYSLRLFSSGYKICLVPGGTVTHVTNDRNKSMKKIFSNIRKYKIYLTSIAIYLLDYKPFYVFLIWVIKLPFVLAYSYVNNKK